jgi:hypothetical protein
MILDGTNGITYPVATATGSAVQASAGRVLQVVSGTYSTLTSFSSTSFTDTGLSLSITPSSSASKILVMVSQPVNFGRLSNAINGYYQLVRGSTAIFNGGRSFGMYANTATDFDNQSILNSIYLDSPATTSSTTYKTQAKLSTTANSAIVLFQQDSAVASITLMEISA